MKQQIIIAPNLNESAIKISSCHRGFISATSCAALLLIPLSVMGEPESVRVPVTELGEKFVLTGKLGVPFGKAVTVQGIVGDGPSRGYEGGPNLWVRRIDGQAIQERIRIPLAPYYGEWGKTNDPEDGIPKPELGISYEIKGYETGGYVGIPDEVLRQTGGWIQTPPHYMLTILKVFATKRIPDEAFAPDDFKGRKALLSGVAKNHDHIAMLDGGKWSVVVDPKAPWPAYAEGKTVEAYGFYDADQRVGRFTLRDGVWRLVHLEDQVGRAVELRGRAIADAEGWWFDFRGSNVLVDNMNNLPGWIIENHFRPIIIRGTLERSPAAQVLVGGRSMHYIVRNASWEPLPNGLLTPELVERVDLESE